MPSYADRKNRNLPNPATQRNLTPATLRRHELLGPQLVGRVLSPFGPLAEVGENRCQTLGESGVELRNGCLGSRR
jgi:hypothetical protein